MGWINFDNVIQQLADHGVQKPKGGWQDAIDSPKVSGARTKVDGVRQLGWVKLHTIHLDDGQPALVGSFGWWVGGQAFVEKIKLVVDGKTPTMSKEKREALRARMAEERKKSEAEIKRKVEDCAARADRAWRQTCKEGSRDQSEYLKRKQIDPLGGRFLPGGKFCIPIQDTERRTYGLQVIYDQKKNGRDKSFWPAGLAKKGHFFLIGGIPDRLLLIAEGFATAASIHQATKLPVAVAFDAGNLLPVAKALKAKYKRAKILICADDDYRTEGNPGITHARNAALAVEGSVVFPVFADERPTETKGPTDFNDLHLLEGESAVARQIEAALSELGWAATSAARGNSEQPGGGETGRRRAAQAVMDLDDVVDRFVPLDDGTGEYVFDTWTNKVAKRSQMIALLPAGVRGDDIKRHPVWITRGAYYLDQVGFDPSCKDPDVLLNTWKGWPMKPAAGQCDVLLDLIAYLCGKEQSGSEVYEWLLSWMAWPLQHPGAKMGSAVIMHGPQGTGKTTVFKVMCQIYGQYGLVVDQDAIEDKFNSDWGENRLFILAEEIVSRMEMWHVKNKLKNLVTGDTIRINPKGLVAYNQKNRLNIVYLSNENQPLPLENDDRRHLVIYTPPALSEQFYDELNAELDNGGVEAFYDFLLRRDLSDFHPKKRPPMTQAKRNLISLSATSELRFCQEWILGDLDLPVVPCLATDFYAAYLKWCRANGESRPRPSNQFFGAVAHQQGWEKKKARIYPQETSLHTEPKPMVLPPDDALANAGTAMPAGENSAKWLGECARRFADAVSGSGERWAS